MESEYLTAWVCHPLKPCVIVSFLSWNRAHSLLLLANFAWTSNPPTTITSHPSPILSPAFPISPFPLLCMLSMLPPNCPQFPQVLFVPAYTFPMHLEMPSRYFLMQVQAPGWQGLNLWCPLTGIHDPVCVSTRFSATGPIFSANTVHATCSTWTQPMF